MREFGWEKEARRRINKHDKLFIVKSRQIGASTFLRNLSKDYENVFYMSMQKKPPSRGRYFDLAIFDECDFYDFSGVHSTKTCKKIYCSTPNKKGGVFHGMVMEALKKTPEQVMILNYMWNPEIAENIDIMKSSLSTKSFMQEYLCEWQA